jgi:hypothetical protein
VPPKVGSRAGPVSDHPNSRDPSRERRRCPSPTRPTRFGESLTRRRRADGSMTSANSRPNRTSLLRSVRSRRARTPHLRSVALATESSWEGERRRVMTKPAPGHSARTRSVNTARASMRSAVLAESVACRWRRARATVGTASTVAHQLSTAQDRPNGDASARHVAATVSGHSVTSGARDYLVRCIPPSILMAVAAT